MAEHERVYRVEPTPARLHTTPGLVRGIMGPIGSGKSVACVQEIALYRAQAQPPNKNGVRKTRFAVIRNTYPELKTTTVETWKHWWPDCVCRMTYGSPIAGELRYKCPDGTEVASEIWFVALDKPKDVSKLLSMELTGAWINEAREVPMAIVDGVLSRVGRYPPKDEAPLAWRGLIMDTNPPDTDHWWYQLAEVDRPENWTFYRQPPALVFDQRQNKWVPNPSAENVRNLQLGYDYWLQNVRPGKDAWIKVYCGGEYGYVQDGRPVYPEYSDALHFTGGPIPYEHRLPLLIGMDFGLTPAAVICQYYPGPHRLAVLHECVSENMGLDQFLETALMPLLARAYPGLSDLSQVIMVGDPAGGYRTETDETSCYDVLRRFGFDPREGRTNDLLPRLDSVKRFLNRLSGGRPGLMISSNCPTLRKGLMGKYRFGRVQIVGEERYRDKPVKDLYSHCQDGLQYVAMEAEGGIDRLIPRENTIDMPAADAGRW